MDSLKDVWKYPEGVYEELRHAVCSWLGVPLGQVLPGHGIQALVVTVGVQLVSPGDRVVVRGRPTVCTRPCVRRRARWWSASPARI